MPIAELFLSSVVQTLLNQLPSVIHSEYARLNGISQKLTDWKGTLQMIESVMDSAEEKQMGGNSTVDQWLSKLRDVAYDMEDILDDLSIEAKRYASKSQSQSRKHLPSCLIACCSRIDPPTWMANEIEEVDHRLEEILRQKEFLQLEKNFGSRPPAYIGEGRFTTTAVPEPKFVGREKQTEELLAQLTGNEATEDSLRPFTVVSIVGMGGLGKTTLAQELYNHELVSSSFNVRAWACVSDVFDRVAITKSVLQCVDASLSCEGQDLNWLQGSLKEKLSGKKFLVVLDDVWNENYEELKSLLKPFFSGSRGSKILLTTRNKEVAKKAGDRSPRELDLLSPDDCLSLLAYHAIGEASFDGLPHLGDVAVQLAKKCNGLPLAAKMIGGLLRFESDVEKWKQLLDNGIWTSEGGRYKILPTLKLSYIHLPIHLKRCFAVCALFPKDYMFDGDELIRLWISQGLLHKTAGKTYQDVGMDYLSQLEARSLLQKAGMKETRYSMHNLNNDLAKSIVGSTYFSSDEYGGSSCEVSLANVRHAAMVTLVWERCPPSRVVVYHSMKKLRTFMPFQISTDFSSNVSVSNKVIRDLIMNMKLLRMLSLRYFCITEVPNGIGELKLLRSLDFSYTKIDKLPESICELLELRSLLLQGCQRLKELPRDIHKLTNLLHLDITDAFRLQEMPPHIGDLTNLEILSGFVVGKEAGQHLKELGPLNGLHGDLRISNLLEVDNIGDARIANLHEKERVSKLRFDWGSNVGISSDNVDNQLKILDHLQPPIKIECVSIYRYRGRKFSSWFGNPCMDQVVSITLKDCKSVESLPPFGRLPLLAKLDISGLEAVSMIGAEFYETDMPFRSLKSLSFSYMLAWEKWSSRDDCGNDNPFPRLHVLTLRNCPELKGGLPGRLDSLFKLVIKDCPFLKTSGDTLSLPSLREMGITNCDDQLLKCMVDVTSMTTMTISKVPQLVFFDRRFSSYWVALEEISIERCPRFKSFRDGDGVEQILPKLKKLAIEDIADLEMRPDDWYCLRSLNEMTIRGCPKLSLFPNAGLPSALRKVALCDCLNLPASEFHSVRLPLSLEVLKLFNLCRSLCELRIDNCGGLTTLPDSLQHMSNLSELRVSNCKALEVDCFPALPCNLVSFELVGCPKVKSLPHDMRNLTSLKTLRIGSCYSISCLPRGGLPPKLEVLHIWACQNLNQPLEEWGLAGLTALRELRIGGEMGCVDEMVCFPFASGDAWRRLLPSSLMKLVIERMKKVERLANGLRANLTSLKHLYIWECWKMKEFPEDKLPDSLEDLSIIDCPLLEKRCNGDYRYLLQFFSQLDGF